MLVYKADNCRVHRLRCLRCNCYLVQTGSATFLVDTSVRWEGKTLLNGLASLDVKQLDGIFITHVHTDHVGNAALLQRHFACPVYAHPLGVAALEAGRCATPRGTNPGTELVYRVVSTSKSLWKRFEPCAATPLTEMPLGDWYPGAYVLETPGHTVDSTSLVLPATLRLANGGGAAFVGDAMVHNRPGELYPPFADSRDEIEASWQRLLSTGCSAFLPGHGRPVSMNTLRREAQKRLPEAAADTAYIRDK